MKVQHHSFLLMCLVVALCFTRLSAQPWKYPASQTVHAVDAPDLRTWIERENQLTEQLLASESARCKIKARFNEVCGYPRYGAAVCRGSRYVFVRNGGFQILEPNTMYETPGRPHYSCSFGIDDEAV